MGIADEKYVSITTTRRNGETVSSPVWIAPLPDGTSGFTTGATSGKVKRIRNNPAVTLRPCDARGRVKEAAAVTTATATILVGDEMGPIRGAIRSKYGFIVVLLGAFERVRSVFKKGADDNCVVHLHFE